MINKIKSDIVYIKYEDYSDNLNTYKIKYKHLNVIIRKKTKRFILYLESGHRRSKSFLFRKDFYKTNYIKECVES